MPESERNSATGVRTRVLRFCSPSLWPLHHEDTPSLVEVNFNFKITFTPLKTDLVLLLSRAICRVLKLLLLIKLVDIYWLIDFNGIPHCLILFYALKLSNCVHYTFIFKSIAKLLTFFYTNLYDIKYSYPMQMISIQLTVAGIPT